MNEPLNPEVVLLNAVLELGPAERAAYLEQACAGDAGLRQQVEALLRAHEQAEDFLEAPPVGLDFRQQGRVSLALSEKPGDTIGRYKLLQQIGEGGCGVVYMAEQEEPVRRRVALKIIKLGMDTKQVIARFEAERQALALMDHPNIARVFDAGATGVPVAQASPPASSPGVSPGAGSGGGTPPKPAGEDACATLPAGRPYFVMELVRGIKITDFCDENKLSTQDRLKLFVQVCHAIQHAHQKGVIHRDIKPSNILVTINDGVPVPKVIDFGIAKATQGRLTDQTLFTAFEQFIGTPAYMSPEQAVMTSLDIDTRSDIYSLGVLLYELLTGRPPFDQKELLAAGLDEMRRTIREKEPERPSTRLTRLFGAGDSAKSQIANRKSQIDADLDWIVMKCLEKDRARRYETANGLATDIQRHLSNEPVVACPPSKLYKFQKLVRRNKFAFAAGASVAAALVLGLAIALWQSIEKTRAYNRAVAAEQEALAARARAEANEKKARASEQQAQTEAAKSAQVAQLLKNILKSVPPSVALGRDTTLLRQVLDDAAQGLEKGLTNQPEVEMALREVLAQTYADMGLVEKMEQMTLASLQVARARLGEEHPAFADALARLGEAQFTAGKLDAAERSLREARTRQEKLRGTESDEVANTINNLGGVLWRRGNLAEAESLSQQALAIRRKLHGNEHASVAGSLDDLACILQAEGKLAKAHTAFLEALEINRKLGPETPIVAVHLCNLAILLQEEGNLAEAEARCREALELDRKVNAETTDLPWILNNLGNILRERCKLADAEAMIRDALARRRKLVGNEHPDVALSLRTLAAVLRDENRPLEAEAALREALDTFRKKFGGASRDVAKCFSDLALSLHDQGRLSDAEAAQTNALAIQRTILGSENPAVATSLANLARLHMDQGKAGEAERSLRECLAIREKLLPDHWRTFDTRSLLGASLLALKQYSDAEPFLLAGYEGMKQREERIACDGKLRFKEALQRLAQFYEETARPERAAEWKQKLTKFEKAAK